MSVENRRKALLGFGILAAVLIVAIIVTWPPPYFENRQATGAIGAVEKHRETQITPQDVVLGDEATRREQKVAFGDYLDDATKLQSISAELAARAEARNRAQAAARQLASMTTEMQARYVSNMEIALAAIAELMAGDANVRARLANEVADIGARVRSRQLSSVEMQDLSARLASVAEQIEAANLSEMEARTLASIEEQLGKAVAAVRANASKALIDAAAEFEAGSRALAARYLGNDYSDYVEYLSAQALEAKALANAEEELEAVAQLQNEEEMAARLNRVSRALADEAFALEARALRNAEEELEARTALAARLHNFEDIIAAANRAAAARTLQSEDIQVFTRATQTFSKALESRNQEFRARSVANIESELAMLGAYMDDRRQLQARMLQAQPMFAARLANLDDVENHLVSLSRSLATRSLASYIENPEQLEARVRDLKNRVALAGSIN